MNNIKVKTKTWIGLGRFLEESCPSNGKRVEVKKGKHKGKIGIVFWHGKDRFKYSSRYDSSVSKWTKNLSGISGFRCGVDSEGDKFFVSAEDVEIAHGGENEQNI
tara:strand:+ start:283 stop:597 length:315 start_codon:yes stop_codon:yes gene_type:complete